MTSPVTRLLSQSASDFVNIVWPAVKGLPLIGGGQLQPVEASSDAEFAKTLDMLAGIDAWQVLTSPAPPRQNRCRPHRTLNLGAMMEEQVGQIRTSIQGPCCGAVAAA